MRPPKTVQPDSSHSPDIDVASSPGSDSEFVPGSSGVRPSSSRPVSKKKAKRLRLTTPQLRRLEGLFLKDPAPHLARRTEIAVELGMAVKQVQVWFQNRRAKEKGKRPLRKPKGTNQDEPPAQKARRRETAEMSPGLPEAQRSSPPPPQGRSPSGPLGLSKAYDPELEALINEPFPISIIPCNELRVGTWKRIALLEDRFSLVTTVCPSRSILGWYMKANDRGYKMQIPFSTILKAEYENVPLGAGEVSIILTRPPNFFIEIPVKTPVVEGQTIRHWASCSDWTADRQATQNLLHRLIGPTYELLHLVELIRKYIASKARPQPSRSASQYLAPTSPPQSRGFIPALHTIGLSPQSRRASLALPLPVSTRTSSSTSVVSPVAYRPIPIAALRPAMATTTVPASPPFSPRSATPRPVMPPPAAIVSPISPIAPFHATSSSLPQPLMYPASVIPSIRHQVSDVGHFYPAAASSTAPELYHTTEYTPRPVGLTQVAPQPPYMGTPHYGDTPSNSAYYGQYSFDPSVNTSPSYPATSSQYDTRYSSYGYPPATSGPSNTYSDPASYSTDNVYTNYDYYPEGSQQSGAAGQSQSQSQHGSHPHAHMYNYQS